MSHPFNGFGVAISQKKFQVDKKKKHAYLFVNICVLTREFSINRTLLILSPELRLNEKYFACINMTAAL